MVKLRTICSHDQLENRTRYVRTISNINSYSVKSLKKLFTRGLQELIAQVTKEKKNMKEKIREISRSESSFEYHK